MGYTRCSAFGIIFNPTLNLIFSGKQLAKFDIYAMNCNIINTFDIIFDDELYI
jgi:hypothetical protein